MAAEKKDFTKWRHLKSAMTDLQDLLRCWTCNKVFTDPVSYRCGHFFCGRCAKEAGTKCGSCNVPSLASEVRPDRIITDVIGCFQTLTTLVNSDRLDHPEESSCNDKSKSSRSTVNESDVQSCSKDSKSKPGVQKECLTTNGNLERPLTNVNNNPLKKSAEKRPSIKLDELPTESKPDEEAFLKPLKKAPTKENQKALSSRNKSGTTVSTKQGNSRKSLDTVEDKGLEVKAKPGKKPGRPRGRPPTKRLSTDSLQSEGVVSEGENIDNIVLDDFATPKKPRRSSNAPSSSKANDIDLSMAKSTPRKVSTPAILKKNHKGETPLHVACIRGHVDRIRSLLQANASPNTKDNAGWTPLHEAAIHGFTEVVELLLAAGALVDVPGAGNVTPLHEAVVYKHIPIVKLLVSYGADINARSSEGKTPMDLAESEDMKEALLNTKKSPLSNKVDSNNLKPNLGQQEMVLCGDPGLTAEEKKDLFGVAVTLNARLVPAFGPDVTHFVVPSDASGTCPPSMEVLCAILKGVHILTRDWIQMSKDGVMDSEVFELSGVTDFIDAEAPKQSRVNAEKQLPGLFNGCHFYVTNNAHYNLPSCTLNRANLITLIKEGGGIVLSRQPDPEAIPPSEQTVPYHADRDGVLASTSHIILYSPGKGEPELKYNMKHCKSLSVEWFINCVLNWQLIDP